MSPVTVTAVAAVPPMSPTRPHPVDITVARIQRWASLKKLSRDKWPEEAKASLLNSLARVAAVLTLKRAPVTDDWAGAALCVLCYSVLLCNYYLHAFVLVLVTWLTGSFIVFLMFRMLASTNSLENVIVATAYSLAPLIVLEPIASMTAMPLPGLSVFVKLVSVLWGSRSAALSLVAEKHEGKMLLFLLPLVLFNIFLISLQSV